MRAGGPFSGTPVSISIGGPHLSVTFLSFVSAQINTVSPNTRNGSSSSTPTRNVRVLPNTSIIPGPRSFLPLCVILSSQASYATMSHEDLLALPVPSWVDDNSHLYLWVTNSFIRPAHDLMEHWGFDYKTMLTWNKPGLGLGNYFRSTTEAA